ncbi:MAG: 2Fe-2S iron-sulfur cluster-binding protein, partial [Acidobacteriota bacterium]
MPELTFRLNGQTTTVNYEEGMHFLEVLREACGVTSAKDGCAPQGYCGCCKIMVDGRPTLSCLRKPEQMQDREVVTLEGLEEAKIQVLTDAFVQDGGIQCGFCTPGIVMRAASLLDGEPDRDRIAKGLAGHLCRCTGYSRIVDAVQSAAEAWQSGQPVEHAPRRPDFFGQAHGLERSSSNGDRHGVGGSSPRYRGHEHAMGHKPYVADMQEDGMLHAAVVFSQHPRARVVAIDPAPALAMAGVERVVTAEDVPGERHVGLIVHDWPIFVAAGEITRCVGDVIALVVADSAFHARQAAAAVGVDYEVLEPVSDPYAALEPGAPQVHASGNLLDTCSFSRGDIDAALAEATHVLEETYSTQRIEHAFLEPEACLAKPDGDSLRIYSQTQGV